MAVLWAFEKLLWLLDYLQVELCALIYKSVVNLMMV